MMRIVPAVALVGLCRWHCLLAYVLSTTTAKQINTDKENSNTVNKSLEFVNIIRDDLRRNNDDYEPLEGENQLSHTTLPGSPAPRQPYRNMSGPRSQPAPRSPARAPSLRRFESYTRSKHYKSLRLNKLKQLNKDNINMRQEDLGEDEPQAEGQPEAGVTTSASPPTTRSSPPPSPLTRAPSPLQIRREQGSMQRSRKDQSPSPEQLDMAPARNPEFTRIRIKGRLCQRSLMNAEGPTYDQQGKLLEPAFRPSSPRGRQFHQTRAPRLVLPRCCNCCKKSVLGCQ